MSGPDAGESTPRRSFLKEATAVSVGALATLVPVATGVVVWCNPLRRTAGGPAGFLRVAPLEAVPPDGVPRQFTVLADRVDAWTKMPAAPIGAVYLRRTDERTVEALQCICPHAGCFIDYRPDRKEFLCPCHNSTFALDGRINDPNSPSPRPMDTLDVEIRDRQVWVRFENFQAGHSDKRVQA